MHEGKLFGQRVIERGFASEADILEALRAQYVANVVLGKHLFLGEILLLQGKITPHELALVVRETGAAHEEAEDVCGRRFFGDVAVELGFCTPSQVLEALDAQREEDARGARHRLVGEVLFSRGFLTKEQVAKVVERLVTRVGEAAPVAERE
jgi:hypothetical protein